MINIIKKFLALINTAEGFIHIIIAVIGFWGIFATGIYDWRIVSATSVNVILGVFSLLTGYILISDKFDAIKKIVGWLNTLEGAIHIVVAAVGFWGIFANLIWDWRIWSVPTEHLVFGILSLITGHLMVSHHHHHHHKKQ